MGVVRVVPQFPEMNVHPKEIRRNFSRSEA